MTEDHLLRDLTPRHASSAADGSDLPTAADTRATLTDLPPPRVPGYEILGEVGRGGMGVVYMARQVKAGRVVALKVILGGGHAGATERARFRTEAQAAARLHHPNVVPIHEVGEHDGVPYFSLEFCPGGSLDKKLNGTPLPPAEAAAVVEALAHGVQEAHDKGVVHRDLKTANVLFAENGTPKVTDFGLAKKLDEAGHTATGAVLGTPSYMAPEQARGDTLAVGPLSDVYALGAVLYECLTGRPPFRSGTAADTLLQVLHDEPVPPARLQGGVPRDLETICLKCLQKDPRRRYASADDLADDLERFLAGKPIVARPVSAPERVWRWGRRKPLVAALLALLALVVCGSLAGLTGLYLRAEEQRRHAEEEAERARRNAEAQAKLRHAFGHLADVFRAADPLGMQGFTFFTPARADDMPALRVFVDRAAEVVRDLESDPVARAEVLDTVGNLYRTLGRFDRAGPMLEEAVALRREHLRAGHPDTAASLHNLAWLHHDLGRYALAEPLYREALAARRAALGEDDEAVDRTLLNLAWLLTQMGQYNEAETTFRDVLARRVRRHGDGHRDVAIAKAGLAALFFDSGENAKGVVPAAEAARVFLAAEGTEGVGEAVQAFQMGMACRTVAMHAEAERQLRHSADVTARVLGPSHMYLALILHELAATQEERGDLDGAEASYRRCLDVGRRTAGLGHPKAAVGVTSFGSLLSRRGKTAEADALFDELMCAQRRRFGADHPLVADALVEWSRVALERKDDAAEAKLLGDALELYHKAGGGRHRLLARCLNQLALNRARHGDDSAAEKLLEEALPLTRCQFGERHVNCAVALTNLAWARLRRDGTEGVEALLSEARTIAFAPTLFGDNSAVRDDVLACEGTLYRLTGRLREAEAAARKRCDEAKKDRGRLYDSARDLALLVPLAAGDEAMGRRCADRAVGTLARAVKGGYDNLHRLGADCAFDVLRDRPDFRRLVEGAGRESLPDPRAAP